MNLVLVDTSVWIDHLHRPEAHFQRRLRENTVYGHPSVIGELLCGNIRNRREVSLLLRNLPIPPLPTVSSVYELIEEFGLAGRGLGWNDVQLLAAAHRNKVALWTRDRRLAGAALEMSIRVHT